MQRCYQIRENPIVSLIMPFLYKILPRAAWQNAQTQGRYDGSPLDVKDGFIHLSASHQVVKTAMLHFGGQTDLVLVAFPDHVFGASLTWEASRGGDLFPHVYGSLDPAWASWAKPLPLRAGVHDFPPEFVP
jgi:uncharacterized protein (DUF952 family)